MQKPISPTTHGILDYSTVAATAAAPSVLGLSDRAAGAAYGVAGAVAGLAAITDFKPSLKRAVPLRGHQMADLGMGMLLPALPWLLGFARDQRARNFFIGLTAMTKRHIAIIAADAGRLHARAMPPHDRREFVQQRH